MSCEHEGNRAAGMLAGFCQICDPEGFKAEWERLTKPLTQETAHQESAKGANQMSAVLRAKCRISRVSKNISTNGSVESETIELTAVYENSPENKEWSKWTPSFNCTMQINNPDAFDKLSKGHEFYVDFIPAETPKQ